MFRVIGTQIKWSTHLIWLLVIYTNNTWKTYICVVNSLKSLAIYLFYDGKKKIFLRGSFCVRQNYLFYLLNKTRLHELYFLLNLCKKEEHCHAHSKRCVQLLFNLFTSNPKVNNFNFIWVLFVSIFPWNSVIYYNSCSWHLNTV